MTPEEVQKLAKRLRDARYQQGLSTAEVARRSGLNVGTINRIERGLIAAPRAETLLALAAVFDIPATDIFTLTNWLGEDDLPSFTPYMRARYGELPEHALEELQRHFTHGGQIRHRRSPARGRRVAAGDGMDGGIDSGGRAAVLRELRQLLPAHAVDLAAMLSALDQIAARLRAVTGVRGDRFPSSLLAELPNLRIEDTSLPISGYVFWDAHARQWVIRLNAHESPADRRFTLLHEFGHITWHGWETRLFPGMAPINMDRLAEHAADIFAGEVLMPKAAVHRAYRAGDRTPTALARRFGISPAVVSWKLGQMDIDGITRHDHNHATAAHPRIAPLTRSAA